LSQSEESRRPGAFKSAVIQIAEDVRTMATPIAIAYRAMKLLFYGLMMVAPVCGGGAVSSDLFGCIAVTGLHNLLL
jgi:hypothetical protein